MVAGLTGRRVPLHGGGAAKKSYLHARDLAAAIHQVAVLGGMGSVYNVGPAEPTSIRSVAEMCAAAVGKELDEVFDVAPERPGQDSCYWLDSQKIRELGWRPETTWGPGLAEVVEWARANLDQLRDWPTDYQLRS
jgi:dTDP-glucose 4,6-dehydratase